MCNRPHGSLWSATHAQKLDYLLLPLAVLRGVFLLALHEAVAQHEHYRVAFPGHELRRRVVQLVKSVLFRVARAIDHENQSAIKTEAL